MKIVIDGPDQILYQWDRGQRLILDGIGPGIRVDFGRCHDREVPPNYTYEDNGKIYVDIPETSLQQHGQLVAYFVAGDEGRSETFFAWPLTVLHRPKPADYVAPEEIKTWKELDRRLRPLEESGIGDLTSEDEGKLLYVSADGVLVPLKLGPGLAIVDGVLTLTNANTGETVKINAQIVDGVLTLTDAAGAVRAEIVDGVLVVSDASGTVKARIEDDVLICEMEE